MAWARDVGGHQDGVVTFSRGSILGATVLSLLVAGAVVITGATCLEFLLRVRAHWLDHRVPAVSQPLLDARRRAYERFSVEHLHPQYFFFFPLDPRERAALSNETCSVDADGFRGPGPARAGDRRLAFLLGGSTAFGSLSSSDDTTIAGYLNRMQDEYFFVNASVPGWNSTQELFRVAFQILDYHPALVLTYDGAIDAELLTEFQDSPVRYPIGTPSNFDTLDAMVREREREARTSAAVSVLARLFPELMVHIDRWRARRAQSAGRRAEAEPDDSTLPESLVRAAAARYLANQARMHDLVRAGGARFITVFQPVVQLHRHIPAFPALAEFRGIRQFHRAVMTQYAHDFEMYDEGDAFDYEYASVPVLTKDLTPSTIFIDEVHVNDPGNEIMARHLIRLIRRRCQGDVCS